jgi:DNA-binding transcriptional MerR regulator/methylmalonyl-CoA mutase cobalamin-binding subunit
MDVYKIDHVAKLTGLSKHVIRSWERRFDLLNPVRGENRYRMYTEQDIELLSFIRKELEKGFTIGELAKLGRENLIDQMADNKELFNKDRAIPSVRINDLLIESLRPFDKNKFIRTLNEAVSLLSFDEVFLKIFVPLQQKVGDLWHEGEIGVGVEHFVSHHIRQKFLSVLNQLPVSDNGPKVVISCLPNDYHELGATMAAYQCAINQCQVFYLGANMPVQGLVEFCSKTRPSLVLLSCTKEQDDSEAKSLADEYAKNLLPICPIWAGGPSMKDILGKYFIENGIDVLDSLTVLETRLKNLPHYLRQNQ